MATIDLSGLKNIQDKLDKIANIDATPLMVSFQRIIEEDNRRGILAGLGKDGKPMAPVTYRPKQQPIDIRAKSSKPLRNNAKSTAKRGVFAGIGIHPAGVNNNLTPAEYRRLSGPPLAPRGVFSRVITNLVTSFIVDPSRRVWTAVGGWMDVVNAEGKTFLHYHFNGDGHLPKRDLRGVRPEGVEKATRSAVAFVRDLIRSVVN